MKNLFKFVGAFLVLGGTAFATDYKVRQRVVVQEVVNDHCDYAEQVVERVVVKQPVVVRQKVVKQQVVKQQVVEKVVVRKNRQNVVQRLFNRGY
jgi:hypothetical protein